MRGAVEQASFVGRERELAELLRRLELARHGEGGATLIAGEPGIGKTRLAEELAAAAAGQGAQVFWGRCYEGEGAPAYWPWVQILRAYARGRERKDLLAELGPVAADLAPLLPDLRERLQSLLPSPPIEAAQARFRLFDAVGSFLARAAERRPLLLLEFLVPELASTPLVVVATYRDVGLSRGDPLNAALAVLRRERALGRLSLRGLSADETAALVTATLGESSVSGQPALMEDLQRKTEGNPFFITETARHLADSGRHRANAAGSERSAEVLGIPDGVRDLVAQRLAGLSEVCVRTLSVASILGRAFDLKALERLSGLTDSQLLEVLEEAEEAHLLEAVPAALGRYRFTHTLIRETLYEELPSMRRVRLHREVGAAIEVLYGADPEHLAELAYHFLKAAPAGESERAVRYGHLAGDRALTLFAYEEAAHQYELALQALALREPSEQRDELERERYALLLALGKARSRAGEIPPAREALLQAAAVARGLHAAEDFARAALGYGEFAELGAVGERQARLLEEALELLGEEDSSLRARVMGLLSEIPVAWRSRERRAEISRESVAIARRLDDPATLAYTLNERHWVLWALGPSEERLPVADEMLRLAERIADQQLALKAYRWQIIDLLEIGDLVGVDAALAAQTALAEVLRERLYLWHSGKFRAMRALLDGRFADTERLTRQTRDLGRRMQTPGVNQVFATQMFMLQRERGTDAELEAAAREFAETYPAIPSPRCAVAHADAELGREAEARAEYERILATDLSNQSHGINWLFGLCLLAPVTSLLKDRDGARKLYTLVLPHAGRTAVDGAGASCLGAVDHFLAILAATLQRWNEAAGHFERALALHSRMGARPLVAHSQLAYAVMLLDQARSGESSQSESPVEELRAAEDNRIRAQSLLAQAQAIAADLGMTRLLRRLDDLTPRPQRRTEDGKPAALSPQSSVLSPPTRLSPREIEVLRLLADGKSNQEIADALVLSVRTVERHLLRIYEKIEVRGRAAATAFAMRHGLL